jgi:glutamine amidotransferase
MCLLITQEKGSSIEEQKLQNAYDNNNDGAGYCFVKNGKIEIKKYRNFKKFHKAYKRDVKAYGKETNFIVHFRIGTHGQSEGTLNVHPFKVRTGLVFAHNGMIGKARKDDIYSDTQTFNQDTLSQLPDGFHLNKGMQTLMAEYIGASKLAFLDLTGDTTIINEHMGHWDGGIWYSNESYKDSYGSYGTCYSYGSYGGSGSYLNNLWNKNNRPEPKAYGRKTKVVGDTTWNCEWCGEETNSITAIDVSEGWNTEDDYNSEPYLIDMCDECVRWEEKKLKDKTPSIDEPNLYLGKL